MATRANDFLRPFGVPSESFQGVVHLQMLMQNQIASLQQQNKVVQQQLNEILNQVSTSSGFMGSV